MSDWLRGNGESIDGSCCWKEGGPKDGRLALTTRGKNLCAVKLAKPTERSTIARTQGWGHARSRRVAFWAAMQA